MRIFIGFIFACLIIGIPIFMQRTSYQSIDEDKFKLYKIKKIGFLFKGMQGESARTHGVILPMLIIQIQGYVLGICSFCFLIFDEIYQFSIDALLVIIITLFIHDVVCVLTTIITGFISKRRPQKEELYYIQEYINLIDRYTDIKFTNNNITKEVKKGIKGKFNRLYDCVTYLHFSKEYAIRFNDDMKADEFEYVFEILLSDLGEPDLFDEWKGYIWKRKGYYILFGLVSLNYNYEIPMICIKRSIFLTGCIKYKKYNFIATSMSEPLIERGINSQSMTYYKINYCKEFGFSAYARTTTNFIVFNYNKNILSISISPIVHEGDTEIMENNKYYKEIKGINELELKLKLEELLEETKEFHGLTK